jgi:hypothetical protein
VIDKVTEQAIQAIQQGTSSTSPFWTMIEKILLEANKQMKHIAKQQEVMVNNQVMM